MKFKSLIVISLCLAVFKIKAKAQPVQFNIDPWHSNVQFTVSFWEITDFSGRFDRFFGTIDYDENDLSKWSADITIDVSSVNTGNGRERRENDLRRIKYLKQSI